MRFREKSKRSNKGFHSNKKVGKCCRPMISSVFVNAKQDERTVPQRTSTADWKNIQRDDNGNVVAMQKIKISTLPKDM